MVTLGFLRRDLRLWPLRVIAKKSRLYESNHSVRFFTGRMIEPEWRYIGISPCWPEMFILDQEYNYTRLRVEVDPVREEHRHHRHKS